MFAWITLDDQYFSSDDALCSYPIALWLCQPFLAERAAIDSGVEEAPYWQMRLLLTTLVIVMHSVILILLIDL